MTIALVDADILAYQVTSASEEAIDWGDDVWTLHGDMKFAKQMVASELKRLNAAVQATSMILCISGARDNNWRLGVWPTYKNHRKSKRKPLIYKPLIEHLKAEYDCLWWPHLEADDVMGFMSHDDTVIISDDKDLKTIPGRLYRPTADEHLTITPEEADQWHLTQTLTGDAVDGYPGCPGVGPVKAKKLLDLEPTWKTVVEAYASQGLTEDEALVQARVSRILRPTEFDPVTQEITLWNPT